MSIKTNAEQIRDETLTGANTATRVGTNLVEIADDLISKQTAVNLNTAKISFDSVNSTRLANTSGTNTGDQDLTGKQDLLVSATNIKTINGTTLLGSGNLVISGGGITGSGTINKIAKFTASGAVGDSLIFDNGINVGIGTLTPNASLDLHNQSKLRLGTSNTNLFSTLFTDDSAGLIIDTNYIGASYRFNNVEICSFKSTGINFGTTATKIIGPGGQNFIDTSAAGNGDLLLVSTIANAVRILTNNVERLKVLSNGNILINPATDNGVDKLQVNGSASVTTLKTSGFTVANLPAPPLQGLGAIAHVTDALNPTYLGTLTGGGTVKCPVFYNGTAWVSA